MITFSHLAVKKWSLAWATREQWRQLSTPFPRHIVRQFQSPYTPSPRGLIATPYSTSVSVPLYAITARSIANQRTSSGVGIGFTFLPHVIIPDKRYGVHWSRLVQITNHCRSDTIQRFSKFLYFILVYSTYFHFFALWFFCKTFEKHSKVKLKMWALLHDVGPLLLGPFERGFNALLNFRHSVCSEMNVSFFRGCLFRPCDCNCIFTEPLWRGMAGA
jgi:hypothetical protein